LRSEGETFGRGFQAFGFGLWSGVSGIVSQPFQGVRNVKKKKGKKKEKKRKRNKPRETKPREKK